jgi:RimJ/RimL family protein N-acetyltransferase
MNRLQLRPFEREHLPLVEPWFTDAGTQRWLGGPGWPRLMLDRADRPLGEFRGAAETGRYRWLAWEGARRWATSTAAPTIAGPPGEGGPGGRGVIGVIDLPAGSISYVADPVLRRRGYCAAMVTAVLAMPELAGIEMFAAGVAPANAGSVACLRKTGFRPLDPEPDWEGVVYYWRFRPPVTVEAHDRTVSP